MVLEMRDGPFARRSGRVIPVTFHDLGACLVDKDPSPGWETGGRPGCPRSLLNFKSHQTVTALPIVSALSAHSGARIQAGRIHRKRSVQGFHAPACRGQFIGPGRRRCRRRATAANDRRRTQLNLPDERAR
jgi:hypothetical protein